MRVFDLASTEQGRKGEEKEIVRDLLSIKGWKKSLRC